MPAEVNPSLATLSDQLILATVLLYVFAMVGYALDLAFGRPRARARTRTRPVPALAAVGAGASPASASGTDPDAADRSTEEAAGAAPPVWAVWAGPAGVVLSWLGWAANLGSVLTRGLAVGRWPWGNMYEFVVAMCLAAVSAFLFMQLRYRIRFLGAFVMVASALGLGFAVRYLHVQAGPVVPALNSYWVAIHVSAAIIASGLFIVAGVSGVLYLVRKDTSVRLPSRQDLERVAHRAIVIGFPIWTFAVIAGALWADKAWGRYWGWDPKEVWAFITWIAYAAYLHARATAGWKGRAAMIVQLVAFACLLFNLVGVNIFLGGLHSYAEVPG
ncbi:ABC-type transport system involved in cytochrome c biogenesis permease subunit [Streptosporangium becharense]|uniref:ABC-type transport system involved in cytochrome c biogenesis permease subunit n=1 Tax=Streptosporangium becharense TaxID=1816182 RepID=A0A7W9MH09_9ACTN|nr:cytochrome c biogenesis protein CcsA [Streptosporangium becharense]MBB2909039.1 ABC-type transport system involved in cytochrome c biogenesis permease subunit [Streptosporangium becharense]MBB5819943.1 ABC-type transport system involved in cytochrome c biogenesis permease subunit [Streptosporangium becharense]